MAIKHLDRGHQDHIWLTRRAGQHAHQPCHVSQTKGSNSNSIRVAGGLGRTQVCTFSAATSEPWVIPIHTMCAS